MKSWDWTHDRGLVWQLLRFSLTYTTKDLTKFAIFVNINVSVTLTSVRPDMTSSVSSSPLCPVSPGLLGDGGWLRTEGGRSRGWRLVWSSGHQHSFCWREVWKLLWGYNIMQYDRREFYQLLTEGNRNSLLHFMFFEDCIRIFSSKLLLFYLTSKSKDRKSFSV